MSGFNLEFDYDRDEPPHIKWERPASEWNDKRWIGPKGTRHLVKSLQEEFVSSEIDKKAEKIKADLRKKIKINERDGSGVTEAQFEGLMDNLFMKFRSEVSEGYGIDVTRGVAEEDPERVMENVAKGKRYSKVDGRLIDPHRRSNPGPSNENIKINRHVDIDDYWGKKKDSIIICKLVKRDKKHEMIGARRELLDLRGGDLLREVFIK